MGVSVLFLYPLRHDPVRIPAATLVKPSRAACGVSSRTHRPGPDPPPPPRPLWPALWLQTLLAAVMNASSFPARSADSSAHFSRILPGWEWLDGHSRLHIHCSPFPSCYLCAATEVCIPTAFLPLT